MATDLIFDFFGTLVKYESGLFHSAPYSRTYDYLLDRGFLLSYEAFTNGFETATHTLETHAQLTGEEYHMNDLAKLFFHANLATEATEACVNSFVKAFIEEWGRGIVHFAGIAELMERLASKHRLSILSNTNYPPLIHDNLKAMGIASHFSEVFTSVEIGVRKPYSAIFESSIERLSISADEAIYIGDTYRADYQGATSVGMRCILIDPKREHLDVADRIDSLFELEQKLVSLNLK